MHSTLDPSRPIDISRGRSLPHWYQEGSTHSVTFRLADSLPKEKRKRWQDRRCQWLRDHGLSFDHPAWRDGFMQLPAELRREYHQRFSEGFQKLLDQGFGGCLLAVPKLREILLETLHHFDGDRYELGDYVVMPNHVHALVTPLGEHTMKAILRGWKMWSAKQINLARGVSGSVWQTEGFDHLVRHEPALDRIRAYIQDNPIGLRDGTFTYRRVMASG